MIFSCNDISIIIPTYNRAKDLRKTLQALLKPKSSSNDVHEIIIVDQSKNDETKKLVESFKSKKLKYVFSMIPSITIARNIGVRRSSVKTKLISFLDDDVSVSANFYDKILEVFNLNESAMGVAAFNQGEPAPEGFFQNMARRFFRISHRTTDTAEIISAYGNTYPRKLKDTINCQWMPGVNMTYRKGIFSHQKFDENLRGYTVAEDIDFTYRLYKKYPDGLFITPHANIIHRCSNIERLPTQKMSYINQIDHFYFFFKNLDTGIISRIKFGWTVFGITLLRLLNVGMSRSSIAYLKWKYYLDSLLYCLKHIKQIKSMNEDTRCPTPSCQTSRHRAVQCHTLPW